VDDIHALFAKLKAAGVRLLDAAPRPGAHGTTVCFVHPQSTGGVLVELVQG
jgi:methylmalonyl-CoA/ethylmalonyl-CoA epimerase